MSIPNYLTYSVITGCVVTIAAALIGVSRALKRSNWNEMETRAERKSDGRGAHRLVCGSGRAALLGVYRGAGDRFPYDRDRGCHPDPVRLPNHPAVGSRFTPD